MAAPTLFRSTLILLFISRCLHPFMADHVGADEEAGSLTPALPESEAEAELGPEPEPETEPEPEPEPELEPEPEASPSSPVEGRPPASSQEPTAPTTTTTTTTTSTRPPPPNAVIEVARTMRQQVNKHKSHSYELRCRINVDPPSLSLKSFLATQSGAEVVIPTQAVYQAANDYLSRNPMATAADFTFGVTVTDAAGSTNTVNSTISKDQSLDFVVTPQYCSHVATDYDSGVALQWSVTCPDDLRTADQLLRLSSDGRTASVRPFSLTPGYTYNVNVALRYTSNASLSASKSFAVSVKTEKILIRFQFVIVKRAAAEETFRPEENE
ncbi:hypothetical protein Emag_001399 [Eimeria magna]